MLVFILENFIYLFLMFIMLVEELKMKSYISMLRLKKMSNFFIVMLFYRILYELI